MTPLGRNMVKPLHWRHTERDGVSNHQTNDCLLNCLFRRRSKKTSKLRVTSLCAGNSPVTGEFPTQNVSNAENVSIWWRHMQNVFVLSGSCGLVQCGSRSILPVSACNLLRTDFKWTLRWRHNELDSVSNHQPHDCLLNRSFGCGSKKTSKLRVTGLCVGNSPVTGEFPAQMASNAENVSIWWRHHEDFVLIRLFYREWRHILIQRMETLSTLLGICVRKPPVVNDAELVTFFWLLLPRICCWTNSRVEFDSLPSALL